MLFLLIKWIHVYAAITAVGANITYGVWTARASRAPEVLPFTLRTIKFLDDRIANPAYVLLLLTGGTMVWLAQYPMKAHWLLGGLVLYVAMALLAVFGYTPTLTRQIAALEQHGPTSLEYRDLADRARGFGIALGVIVTLITMLMVFKP